VLFKHTEGRKWLAKVNKTQKEFCFPIIVGNLLWSIPHRSNKLCYPRILQVGKHQDPQDACLAVVVESYKAWLATEARTDDITVIIIQFELGEGLTCALLWSPPLKRTLPVWNPEQNHVGLLCTTLTERDDIWNYMMAVACLNSVLSYPGILQAIHRIHSTLTRRRA